MRKIFQIELEPCKIPFDAGKIETLFPRLVLLEMKDVPTMPVNEIRNRRIQPLTIRALQQEDSAVFQVDSPGWPVILSQFSEYRGALLAGCNNGEKGRRLSAGRLRSSASGCQGHESPVRRRHFFCFFQ